MGKFKTGLASSINQEIEYEHEQQQLKAKHAIEDENVVVVEKRSFGKFFINLMISMVKFAATLVLTILAAAGLICLIYPAPRMALLDVLNGIVNAIFNMVG